MTSADTFDVVVLGSGSGGRGIAKRLLPHGKSVAIVEQELFGGECPYWACMPTKTLLRAPEVQAEAMRTPGLEKPDIDWPGIVEYRDYMNSGLDDAKKVESFEKQGAAIIRGSGAISAPGQVDVDGRTLTAGQIVIATGSEAVIPDIDGLDSADYWTNREATALKEVPESAIVLGGGPVGIELAQMLHRFGAKTTIVEAADRLLSREDASVGERIAKAFENEGIEVIVGQEAKRVDGRKIELEGRTLEAERLVIAVGRKPRTPDIEIDGYCRVVGQENVWAIGDVTGVGPFTHVAAYQAQIAASDMLGSPRRADYRAIPRVVFSDPEIAAVGLTVQQAGEEGIDRATATVELEEMDRTETYGKGIEGHLGLLADRDKKTIVGAWATGPLSGEWIHTLVLAIKTQTPIDTLRDTIFQFPTFSEAIATAVGRLEV